MISVGEDGTPCFSRNRSRDDQQEKPCQLLQTFLHHSKSLKTIRGLKEVKVGSFRNKSVELALIDELSSRKLIFVSVYTNLAYSQPK